MLKAEMRSVLRALGPWTAVGSLVVLALLGGRSASHTNAVRHTDADEPVERRPKEVPMEGWLARISAIGDEPHAKPDACPAGMLLVEGSYCPDVEQRCLRWMDHPASRFAQYRCAEYAPSKCLSQRRKPMRFCIDRDEHVSSDHSLPDNHMSLVGAARVCAREGKRVCRESEWSFACEGEEMRPYPYGFSRDSSACNADRTDVVDADGKLRDLRAPPGAHPRCVSPFGVRDMAGNLEEMVARDGPGLQLAMKGAFWQPSKNHCRAAQTGHDAWYSGAETGFRCCADTGPAR